MTTPRILGAAVLLLFAGDVLALQSTQVEERLIVGTTDGLGLAGGGGSIVVDGSGRVVVASTLAVYREAPGGSTEKLLGPNGRGLHLFGGASNLVLDTGGAVFVASRDDPVLWSVAPDGSVDVVCDFTAQFGVEEFESPVSLAIDGLGNLYIAGNVDGEGAVYIRTPAGLVSQVLDGTGAPGSSGLQTPRVVPGSNGDVVVLGEDSDNVTLIAAATGGAQELLHVAGLEPLDAGVDAAGTLHVIGDSGTLYRITGAGVTTHPFAGGGTPSLSLGLAVSPAGTAWITHTGFLFGAPFNTLYEVSPAGVVTPWSVSVGSLCGDEFLADSLVLDAADNLYFGLNELSGCGFAGSPRVVMRDPAGGYSIVLDSDGDGAGHDLASLRAIQLSPGGEVLALGSQHVLRVPTPGSVEVPVDASGTLFSMGDVTAVVRHTNGEVFVSCGPSDNVLRVDPTSWAVTQVLDASGDGQGLTMEWPSQLDVDSMGNVYVAAWNSDNVFRVTPAGAVTQVLDANGDNAGNILDAPAALVVDSQDNVFVAGISTNNVFRITPSGVITLVLDASGDGGGNILAQPIRLGVDSADNVYVLGDSSRNVFRIAPSGALTVMIDATGAGGINTLIQPTDLDVRPDGTLFITEGLLDKIYRVSPSGVAKLAANTLNEPTGLRVDAFGSMYLSSVASRNGGALQRIDSGGQLTDLLAGSDTNLSSPVPMFMDEDDRVYVSGNPFSNKSVWRLDGPPAWTDLGGGIPGVAGTPKLRMRGPLTSGSAVDRVLTNVPPNELLMVWISTTSSPLPLLGGTVHAFPFILQLFFNSNAQGESVLSATWPANQPSDVDLYLQFFVRDVTVPGGIGLSNAVMTTTP